MRRGAKPRERAVGPLQRCTPHTNQSKDVKINNITIENPIKEHDLYHMTSHMLNTLYVNGEEGRGIAS